MMPTKSQVLSPRSVLTGNMTQITNYDNMDSEDKSEYQRRLRAKNKEVSERFKYYEMKKEINMMNVQEKVNAIK